MANNSKSKGKSNRNAARPAQSQSRQPGREHLLRPKPVPVRPGIRGSEALQDKVALITGGDSGIGRATAAAFAREGADVAIAYLEEDLDAGQTRELVEEQGRRCELYRGNLQSRDFCQDMVRRALKEFGKIDILVNNAAEQHPQKELESITEEQLHDTFATNVYSLFHLTSAVLPHFRERRSGVIINTTSVTAYRGSPGLVDYAATKGAIVSFTRSLALQLVRDGIRVNAVAPGPVWTPLIAATFPAEKVATFGGDTPMGRAGEPWECAECYVFLASESSRYLTGQVLHPNGGEIING